MKLVFPNGEHSQVLLSPGVNRIGSARDNTIVLDRPGIAAVHCEVHLSNFGVNLQVPSGITNIVVNDKPVREMIALRAGDTIGIGGIIARVAAMDAPRAVPIGGSAPSMDLGDPGEDSGATRVRMAIPKFILRGVSGPVFGKMFPIAGATVIGRAPESGIPVAVDEISRKHVELKPTQDGLSVEDLGSANGTYVNGQRVQKGFMKPGDELRLDAVRFLLIAPGQEVAATKTGPAVSAATGKSSDGGKVWMFVIGFVVVITILVYVFTR
jgi:pSer/pThr/pTyr-binding forkhead associated (FHA) protein